LFEGTFIPTERNHPIVQQEANDSIIDVNGNFIEPDFDRIDEEPWYMVFT